MGKYIGKRILLLVPAVFLVCVIVFALMRLVPGDAVDSIIYKYSSMGISADRAEVEAMLGLDQPAVAQFFTWLKGVLTGDLGDSLFEYESVASIIGRQLPVTLELGGKSPCIVDATAKLPLAARRIVFGKYLNCGQTCVAPDYVLCDVRIRDRLVETIRAEIARQFGADPLQNPDYGKIINEKHFHRLLGLMDAEKIVCGGQYDEKTLRITPTVMMDVDWSDAVMGEEIFGPILPVVTYNAYDTEKSIAQNDFSGEVSEPQAAAGDFVDWAIHCVEEHPHPLALYFFSEDKKAQRRILDHCHFGGGCINDTIIHLATSAMPFGGVGESGMGGYHGRTGFETFSHYRSIVDKKTWMDLPIRYQRYDEKKEKLLRRFLK